MFNNMLKYLASLNAIKYIIIFLFAVIFLGGLAYISSPNDILTPSYYRIAIDKSWYPLKLYDKEDFVSAFSASVVLAIAADQHLPVLFTEIDTGDLLGGLDKGEYEGILSSLTFHDEDALKYISSKPYYSLGPVLAIAASSRIKNLKDLSDKTIGILKGANVRKLLDEFPATNFIYYDYINRQKLEDDVRNNVIDGMILDMIPAYEYTKNNVYQDKLKVISRPLSNKSLRLIMKNNPDSKRFIKNFDEGLASIHKNGIYSHLLLKWELFNPEKF